MNEEEWTEAKDILFLHETGIPPEKIAKVKKISIERVREILGNVEVVVKRRNKMNVVQEVGNQNKWKDSPPSPIEAKEIGEETWAENEINEQEYYETMTKPSKEITKVDRSDRIGEDIELELRLKNVSNEDVMKKINSREEWKDMMEELDDFLDDS